VGAILKTLFLISAVLILNLVSPTVFAEDLNLGGFDPTGNPTDTISDTLAANAALRNAIELLHNNSDPVGGNPNGKVTFVEFFDYRCPHCVRMYPLIEAMIAQHPNLRVVYKMFPVLGPDSEVAAHAALAANMQGKFAAFHRALMHTYGDLSLENMFAIAKANGLDIEKFKHDMNSDSVASAIIFNTDLATRMGINGTPAFFMTKSNLSANSPTADVIFIGGESSASELQRSYDKIH
jgi:protein-disulfide isomerase